MNIDKINNEYEALLNELKDFTDEQIKQMIDDLYKITMKLKDNS